MRWIDQSGDRDNDGFQEYKTRSTHGYYNQGWKDAGDAIPTPTAPSPRCRSRSASCRATSMTRSCGWPRSTTCSVGRQDTRLRAEARQLYDRFNEKFWWEDEGTYYLGLDGASGPSGASPRMPGTAPAGSCRPSARAGSSSRLMAPDMWSGWGIRTLSSDHPLQPVQLSDGLGLAARQRNIAGGFRRYGYDAEAAKVAMGMFEAAERLRSAACPSCSPACPGTRRAFRSSTSEPTCRRLGRPARSSGWSRSCAGSMRRPTPRVAAVRRSGAARVAPRAQDPQPAGRRRRGGAPLQRARGRGPVQHDRLRIIHGVAPRPTR